MEAELVWITRTKDKDGFPVEMEHSAEVYAAEKSIVRAEFYDAMRSGVEVKAVLEVRQEDYELSAHVTDGKKAYAGKVRYDGQTYDIKRTYKTGKSKIELVCG